MPRRVKTLVCSTISSSVPSKLRPPMAEYSPSLFSRTTMKSMSPGCRSASGDLMPGISRTGRMLAYCWKPRRSGISRPQSEMWSGTFVGKPTAPRKIASCRADLVEPVLGHHVAVLQVVIAAPGQLVPLEIEPELAARRLQHPHTLGHHLLADAVAGDHRNPVLFHLRSSMIVHWPFLANHFYPVPKSFRMLGCGNL